MVGGEEVCFVDHDRDVPAAFVFLGGEQSHAWRVVSTVINLMLIALTVLAISLFILAPVVMEAITPGFGPAQLDKTVELTRTMLLSPIFLAMGAVATSVLNAGGRFAASAIAPVVYNLAIIGGALILVPGIEDHSHSSAPFFHA